jgi:CheY-like chemotaxis protein
LHGGSIGVASDGAGRGATFTVKLPLMIVHAPSAPEGPREQPRTDRHPAVTEAAPRLDGLSILAVDDDPDSLSLLRAVLESAGATVTAVSSGTAALGALETRRPDVLLADVGMPGMDGFQLVRAVRRMAEPLRSTPAAALTAYARAQDRISSFASGFDMHLVKPIDPVELVFAVASLAQRRLQA